MKVFIEKENKHVELERECNGKELLDTLGINPATVLLIRNGEAALLEEDLSNSDEVQILSVVSGG